MYLLNFEGSAIKWQRLVEKELWRTQGNITERIAKIPGDLKKLQSHLSNFRKGQTIWDKHFQERFRRVTSWFSLLISLVSFVDQKLTGH